ncbi:MAG: hypothetical protein COT28_08855 [Methylobacterium sp. CG08_land_8_20_14_0_20_71_15]|uniref:Uncharacterized protein n=1 Tax=Methylobacterium jeotgali TaxID=381630 RepID=A0ABQ4SY22_9HYPH|nr:hypothetical protein [Methylobacterium jeotgali]PIU06299.1 MAG: hypothetical protein COT56_10810 [Methylobacterium sp. CG09_land_8_20_14_0_10_71_15]PIU14124.1 MAG: hypothetical protein COT28_08855 [Methylobacterium sp. CG08_land_8_20_14_0_20_71_15]GBU17486.1 hypothetical protein AwMethylo_17010 [Methylobacterium sp.]GJE06714.1 hypothetical protein AOPFMNJM_2036 [Methylobacterium jeotgali]
MEIVLILAAFAAIVVAGATVAAMAARGRRPPMRLANDLDEGDEALLLGDVGRPPSPIDRSAETAPSLRDEADHGFRGGQAGMTIDLEAQPAPDAGRPRGA